MSALARVLARRVGAVVVERTPEERQRSARVAALHFAATCRGASTDAEATDWALDRGYLLTQPDGRLSFTEAGIARADEIVAGDPGLFDR